MHLHYGAELSIQDISLSLSLALSLLTPSTYSLHLLPRRFSDSPTPKQGEEESEENVYTKFMKMLVQLVKGDIETSKFEDDCRSPPIPPIPAASPPPLPPSPAPSLYLPPSYTKHLQQALNEYGVDAPRC